MKLVMIVAMGALAVANAGSVDIKVDQDAKITITPKAGGLDDTWQQLVAPLSETPIFTPVSSWDALRKLITAATGQKEAIHLRLSTPFDMSGYTRRGRPSLDVQAGVIIDGNGVVLDGDQTNDRFFSVGDGFNAGYLRISNLTFTHGNTYKGGAIQVAKYGEVELTDCTFADNSAVGDYGGAMWVGKGGTATLNRCVFSGNQAAGGGAVSVHGEGSTATLTGCSFTGNSVSPPSPHGYRFGGGAIDVGDSGTATLSGCTFSGNSVPTEGYGGGAVYVGSPLEGGGEVLLRGCVFTAPISDHNNDVLRKDDPSAKVTFACADGLSGSPVQMTETEASVLPPKSLVCAP